MSGKANEIFNSEETKERFEAALRGARIAEPHPMKDIPPKRAKKERPKTAPKEKE